MNSSDLKLICINTAVKLFDLPDKDISDTQTIFSSKLILPVYNTNLERVSEQEARFLFINEINNFYKMMFYSIETPTKYNYIFSKHGEKEELKICMPSKGVPGIGKSARIDVSLYTNEKESPFVNVEFKAKTVDVKTDFLKLFAEPSDGLFFHLLNSVDKNTLTVDKGETGVLTKYKSSIEHLNSLKRNQSNNSFGNSEISYDESKKILFFLCCLSPKFILSKKGTKKEILNSGDFFDFVYKINHEKVDISNLNGWDFVDFS
jgi:hypothetical protein